MLEVKIGKRIYPHYWEGIKPETEREAKINNNYYCNNSLNKKIEGRGY